VKLVDLVLGLRISIKEEELGIDLAVHGEVAYQS
jgi:ammonia channel protein AmtB